MLSFGIDSASQSFCHSFIVLSMSCWPRNLLFKCDKSLLLLWKPHSWF